MKKKETKQTGIISMYDMKTTSGKIAYWSFFTILCLISIVALIPAIWTFFMSLKEPQEIFNSTAFFPQDMSFKNLSNRIIKGWEYLDLELPFINTIFLSIGNLVMRLLVCGLGGYVISKVKPKGYKFIFTLVVWTMMMPSQIRMVPVYISYLHFPFGIDVGSGVNILDTYWPMWFEAASDAFAILLFKNSFDALSDSYVEAARIDGCSTIGIFFKIMLPLSKPIIIYESINVLTSSWSNFFTPLLVINSNEKVVLPLAIYRLKQDTGVQLNEYFLGLVFASIPAFLIYAIFQKHIMGGINIGGVKG